MTEIISQNDAAAFSFRKESNCHITYLKDNKDIDNTILWLSAFRSHYKESIFMTFVRGTLRYSSFGNHPTRAVATGEHGFLDCKKRK